VEGGVLAPGGGGRWGFAVDENDFAAYITGQIFE
jgi:hypothetical protein